jgi:hypothetical protein
LFDAQVEIESALQEADMARQHKRVSSTAVAALAGLGFIILFAMLNGPAAHLTNILGTEAGEALRLLPYLVPAAWQAFEAYAFDHQSFSPCLPEMLVSCWPMVDVIAGTD